MVAYCNAVWSCRYFWLSLVRMDLRARYRGSVLGMGWSLLHPLAMTAIFSLVFCRLFGHDLRYYAPYVLIGMSCWRFFVECTISGCLCFSQAESYIRHHPAPLAIYPLRVVLGTTFHLSIALVIATLLSVVSWGKWSLAALLSVPATMLLLMLLGWSLGVLGGLIHVHFRDTKHITEIAFQALFYLTPVFYTSELLDRTGMGGYLRWNPFVPFFDLLRKALLHAEVPGELVFTKACLIVAVATTAAILALSRLERRVIFHL